MDNAQVEAVARGAKAVCKSRKFNCGGTCAPICMQMLGDARAGPHGCSHAAQVHGAFVESIIAAIGPSEYERGAAEERAKIVAWLRESAAWHDKNDDGLSGFDGISLGQIEGAEAIEAGEHLATAISNMEPGK